MMMLMIFWICITVSHIVISFLPRSHCYSLSLMSQLSTGVLLYIVVTYMILFITQAKLYCKANSNRGKIDFSSHQEPKVSCPNGYAAPNVINRTKDHMILVHLVTVGHRISDLKVRRSSVFANLSPVNFTNFPKDKDHRMKIPTKDQLMEAVKKLQCFSTHTIKPMVYEKFKREVCNKKKNLQSRHVTNCIMLWILILILAIICMFILNIFKIKDYEQEERDMLSMLQKITKIKRSILGDDKYDFNWNKYCDIWYQSYLIVVNLVILLSLLNILSISIRTITAL